MTFDVVVVGAGPAGATAAKFLAEKQVKVLLIDKSRFPREKPCGGMIFTRTLKRFPYIPKEIISSYSYGCNVYSSSLSQQAHLQQTTPLALFVIRKWFDQTLVKLAVEQGTRFLDGIAASNVSIEHDKAIIRLSNGETAASQIVIGADGVWSTVARTSGLGQHYPNIARCLYQERLVDGNIIDKYFTKERRFLVYNKFMGINGYGWVIPKNNCVNIGVGEIQPIASLQHSKTSLKEVYHRYLQFLKDKNQIPPTFIGGKIQGGALPLTPLKNTVANRVVLCGDAAGQMNPLTGDGIHYAMSSGKFAADVIIKALEEGRTDASFLSRYHTLWDNDFGKEIRILDYVQKRIFKKDHDVKYIRILSKNPQIMNMLSYIADNQKGIQEYKWKILKDFIPLYMKSFLDSDPDERDF
jgi:geranylgeranyl reductase family protein